MDRSRRSAALAALAFIAAAFAGPAAAQAPRTPPPFLLLNQERILTGSRAGQALLAEEEAARDALRAEAREIDRRFEEEERALTEARETMDPAEFRERADAFDRRVVEARREQDERSNALVLEFERRRRQFYADVAPILVGLLSRYEAYAILDESTVLLADQSLNITDAVIAEIDARHAPEAEAGPEAPPDTSPDTPPDAAPDAADPETTEE